MAGGALLFYGATVSHHLLLPDSAILIEAMRRPELSSNVCTHNLTDLLGWLFQQLPLANIALKGNLVSRLHARIELSRSRFMLIDQSTNGCFILPAGSAEMFLRRDSFVLQGSGVIGLGQSPETGGPQTLEYTCEE